ncbi:zinc finger, CCHC-type containing protein [Tanacetum coccineum]
MGFREEALSFVRNLGHIGEIKHLTDITVDHLHQPWRSFTAIINKCLSGKIDNKEAKKSDKMYYPRFTKAIINHYLKKNPSILMKNQMFMHTARDDTILGIMKFVSKHEDVQFYGALMPKEMTNPEMLSFESFQTYYAIATGAEPPKSKKQRKADSSKSSEDTPTRKSTRVKRSAKVSSAGSKKKATAKADTRKGLKVLFKVALSEEAQLKEVLKRSKQDFNISQASGSGDGTDKGTGIKLGVPDVPKQNSESEIETWGDSEEDDDDEEEASDNDDDNNVDDDDDNDDNNDGDDDDDNDDDKNVDDEEQQEEEKEENADEHVPRPEDMDFSDKEDDEEKNEE